MNYDLFGTPVLSIDPISKINGLQYIHNYIDATTEKKLIESIDKQNWISDLKRRVQHYGYKYNYRAKRIDLSMKIGKLPVWANEIAERLKKDGYFKLNPDQVIVNEYMPGQGITAHIDCEPCFENTIVSLSLASDTTMVFTNEAIDEKIPIILRKRSLVVLKGESRYDWKHSIPSRRSDKINDKTVKRQRRISLTFRRVIL